MNILITGGAGYKGVMLAQKLLDSGHYVTIFDRFFFGYNAVLHLMEYQRFSVVAEDIRNISETAVKGYDAIVHLAALSGFPACAANPHAARLINVEASQRLVALLGRGQLLIYGSTTSLYGSSGNDCDENAPIAVVSLYGETKYQAEQSIMQRENSIALRFATIFGVSPRMRIDLLINELTYRAMNDRCIVLYESSSRRTFLHIRDAVEAYSLALENSGVMQNQLYNVGHESLNYNKLEIARCIQQNTDCQIFDSDIKDLDVRNFNISFRKIQNIGFQPQYSLDDGIKELIKLYKFYKPFSTIKAV